MHHIRFLLAAGEGEELQPLSSVASGGEAARVLLALKVARAQQADGAESDSNSTTISVFDELDSSIGGRLGFQIGNVLTCLAENSHQVLCVTHLPQVAAHAERHIKMVKEQKGQRIISLAKVLDDSQRIEVRTRV